MEGFVNFGQTFSLQRHWLKTFATRDSGTRVFLAMVRNKAREARVGELKSAARADAALSKPRNDASKETFEELIAAIRASAVLSAEAKAAAEIAWAAYLATFEPAQPSPAEEAAQDPATAGTHTRGLRGRGFLLTYNHDFRGKQPGGAPKGGYNTSGPPSKQIDEES